MGEGTALSSAGAAVSRSVREVPVSAVFGGIARSHAPPGLHRWLQPARSGADDCRVVDSREVRPFHLGASAGWADYEEIARAFREHSGRTHVSPLPRHLVEAPIKLVVRDRDLPLAAVVTSERLYPKRAWVAALSPGWDTEMAFAGAGLLNSPVGCLLYHEAAARTGRRGHDVRKNILASLPVPLPATSPEGFRQSALLSYRLHCVSQAEVEGGVSLLAERDALQMRLLSAVVEWFGWDEATAERRLRAARDLIPRARHTSDAGLFTRFPQAIEPVALLDEAQRRRYEELYELVRARQAPESERREFERLERLVVWEARTNRLTVGSPPSPVLPGVVTEREALKRAYGYITHRWGQGYRAEQVRRASPDSWTVAVRTLPTKGRQAEELTLRIDAATGEVVPSRDAVHALEVLA